METFRFTDEIQGALKLKALFIVGAFIVVSLVIPLAMRESLNVKAFAATLIVAVITTALMYIRKSKEAAKLIKYGEIKVAKYGLIIRDKNSSLHIVKDNIKSIASNGMPYPFSSTSLNLSDNVKIDISYYEKKNRLLQEIHRLQNE